MPEDPYTGATTEDGYPLSGLLEDGFYELPIDEDDEFSALLDYEILFNVADTIEGATSLLEIASRLYDLAEELTALSDDGWEIVDDVIEGQATIVQFAAGDVAE